MANSYNWSDLKKIAPPPAPQRGTILTLEKKVKIADHTILLPNDWVNFGQIYGNGTFRDTKDAFYQLRIFNPIAPVFERKINEICDQERASESFHEIFAVFPEKDGLLPLGEDNNDNSLWYASSDNLNEWRIVVIDRGFSSKAFDGSLISFLTTLLKGEISIWGEGHNPFPHGVRFYPDKWK